MSPLAYALWCSAFVVPAAAGSNMGQRLRGNRHTTTMSEAESFSLPFGYTVLGPGREAVARLIVYADQACPTTLMVGGEQIKVTVRAEPHLGHGVFYTDGQRYNSRNKSQGWNEKVNNPRPPFGYADRVCEARVNVTSTTPLYAEFQIDTLLGNVKVPLPSVSPKKFVVLGDTGLRIKPKNDGWCAEKLDDLADLYSTKTCSQDNLMDHYDPSKVSGLFQRARPFFDPADNGWPLHRLASAAALSKDADTVVVHVGDYTYSHAACPVPFPTEAPEGEERVFGDCSGSGLNWGDTSEGWYFEVFQPMADLLRKRPWIVLRGNHEVCNRGGQGWFRYLEPRRVSEFVRGSKDAPFCVSVTDTYKVDFDCDEWIIVDSAELDEEEESIDHDPPLHQSEEDAAKHAGTPILPMDLCDNQSGDDYVERFQQAQDLVGKQSASQRLWLGIHRPLFGLSFRNAEKGQKQIGLFAFTCQLTSAINRVQLTIPYMPAVVSGHYHTWQFVEFDGASTESRTSQLVVGNSGTQLATPRNGDSAGINNTVGRTMLGERIAYSDQVGQFGYTELVVEDDVGKPVLMKSIFLKSGDTTTSIARSLSPKTLHVNENWHV